MNDGPVHVRPAAAADAALIVGLIRELAAYEKLAHECRADEASIVRHLFGEGFGSGPVAECVIGEVDGRAEGFALFFTNFSTFMCRPGIYLEDLYVRPGVRGRGLGRALLRELARLAVRRGCGRVEWSVLDWNGPAIEFYERVGAMAMDEWTVYRLTGEALEAFARGQ
ncbi:MAG: GNAT family N-acetyltransferase [Phycisphaerales bacterium]|nr:GNAT family N-acetyltransferase [Phycisphaerales bacterium]